MKMRMFLAAAGVILLSSCSERPVEGPRKLIARTYNSGFKLAHDTYNGMGCASDGKIYYVLSSEVHDTGGADVLLRPRHRSRSSTWAT